MHGPDPDDCAVHDGVVQLKRVYRDLLPQSQFILVTFVSGRISKKAEFLLLLRNALVSLEARQVRNSKVPGGHVAGMWSITASSPRI